jgi:hypothetical protein
MFIIARMNIRTSFLQQLKHTPIIPVCCAFVSRCLVALRTMESPPLLYEYCLLVVSFLLYQSQSQSYVTTDGQLTGKETPASAVPLMFSYQSLSTET